MGINKSQIVMKNRTVRAVAQAETINMGGNVLDQALPNKEVYDIDPFLLIHHWNHPIEGGQNPRDLGVPPHPHRGFSPVTFVYKGDVEHRDSFGNRAIVRKGGTQWMHAGKGITHSERPSEELAQKGGENEFIQFWVNTPAKHKMEVPYYLPLTKEDTPTIQLEHATVDVVAGEFQGILGPAKTYSPQLLLRMESTGEAELSIPMPESFNALIYVLNGHVKVDGHEARDKDLIWLKKDGDQVNVQMQGESRCILLAGQPLDEKVSSYGPFVMNSQTEIMEAIRDAQMGKMGILIEDF